MTRFLVLTVVAALLAVANASSQVVLGTDDTVGVNFEFTTTVGGPCLAPNPFLVTCPWGPPTCPGMAPLMPLGPGTILGDIADDPVTDVTYVTDGRVIVEYAGDPACAGPCTPIKDYFAPIPPLAGLITGMGCSGTGTFGPTPVLWLTDGTFVWGVTPPAACGAATISFPPCPLPATLVPATDLSWDGGTGTLWVVSATGFVQAVTVPGCTPASPLVSVAACGLGLPLTGLAYDTATPNFSGQPASAYVTDGSVVAYIDVLTGAPAPPTFYTPVSCTPAPGFLSGLALANRGVGYGASRVTAKLSSFGQSTTPGPTFGAEVTGAPAGTGAWLIVNFNISGGGFFCPGLPGVGTKIWVDPTFPGFVSFLGTLPSGCAPLPFPIPSSVIVGLEVFMQVVFLPSSGPPAADATNGMEFAIGLP